jgi:hypothetical protein
VALDFADAQVAGDFGQASFYVIKGQLEAAPISLQL